MGNHDNNLPTASRHTAYIAALLPKWLLMLWPFTQDATQELVTEHIVSVMQVCEVTT